MLIRKFTSRDFNQNVSEAKKAANKGPVFITDRGRPAHVLLNFDEYQRLTGGRRNIADLLSMPGVEDIELELTRSKDLARGTDLS